MSPNTKVGKQGITETDKWPAVVSDRPKQSNLCVKCSAWLGQLGLEPSLELYIEHMVEIFKECWRVLRKGGICFLNISDTYFGSECGTNDYKTEASRSINKDDVMFTKQPPQQKNKHAILKPKDLCLIPFRLAIVLQESGWWVRSDIIISKRNPMPESVTDRPTRSHEYMFMLTKSQKYFYDAEAIRETSIDPESFTGRRPRNIAEVGKHGPKNYKFMGSVNENGKLRAGMTYPKRNCRTVWEVVTEGFPDAHFATFGTKWIWRCIAAGTSEKGCCIKCGVPYKRIVEKIGGTGKSWHDHKNDEAMGQSRAKLKYKLKIKTIGWQPSCKCHKQDGENKIKPCIIFDPFGGSGTTKLVAERMGRKAIVMDLKFDYCLMAKKRCCSPQGSLGF